MQVKYQDEDILFLIPRLVTVNNHCVISDLTLELTTHNFINHKKKIVISAMLCISNIPTYNEKC